MINQTISHYKIIEKLGEGGMGVVYKAQDTKLDRFVALKFLPHHLSADDEEKKRFIHEAKAASALDHPNICTIYEIDETEDGRMFIAMAFYEGETLKKKIERGPLPLDEAINFAIQVAQGLQRAHEAGITHRDIKPANIMITTRGEVKIVDFGLAKLAGRTKLTKEGMTLGTVAYMSPEQARGEEVDHRTDIWSLGVVLYEMICGRMPFRGEYEAALMYSLMNEEPEPITGLRTGVPMELERIVNKSLAKSSGERYQHVDELLVDLKSVGKKLESGVTKKPSIKAKLPKRSAKILYGAIVFIVVLIIGGGIYFLKLEEKDSSEGIAQSQSATAGSSSQWQNSIAVLPFKNISPDPEQEYFCDGMTEQLITNLSQLQALKVIARTSVMKFKDTERTIPEIAEELHVAHILEGSIRKAGNRIRVTAQLIQADGGHHLWAKDYDRELADVFAVQDDVSQAIAGALLEKLALNDAEKLKNKQTENIEAYQYYLKGEHFHGKYNLTRLEENSKKSEEMFKKAIELDPNYALAYAGLADLYNSLSWGRKDEKYGKLQQEYIEIAFKLDPNSALINEVKSYVHSYLNESDDEYESNKRALQLNPNHRRSNHAMGVFLGSRGLHHQAIEYFTKSVELDPLAPGGYSWRGHSFQRIGMFDRAMADYQTAAEIAPDFFVLLGMTANLLISLKKYDEAEDLMARGKEINPDDLSNKVQDAYLYAAKGKKELALHALEQSGSEARKIDKLRIYSLLGLTDEALKLLDDKPYSDDVTRRHVDLDYLDMLHSPFGDNIRDTEEFQAALKKAKGIYEENLRKYREVFL